MDLFTGGNRNRLRFPVTVTGIGSVPGNGNRTSVGYSVTPNLWLADDSPFDQSSVLLTGHTRTITI